MTSFNSLMPKYQINIQEYWRIIFMAITLASLDTFQIEQLCSTDLP